VPAAAVFQLPIGFSESFSERIVSQRSWLTSLYSTISPYQPYLCPVCGADAGLTDRMATILALEFEDGSMKDFPVWSHRKCFDACPEIVEA